MITLLKKEQEAKLKTMEAMQKFVESQTQKMSRVSDPPGPDESDYYSEEESSESMQGETGSTRSRSCQDETGWTNQEDSYDYTDEDSDEDNDTKTDNDTDTDTDASRVMRGEPI